MSGKRGGSLNGNASRKLLSVTNSLSDELALVSEKASEAGQPFVDTLAAFQSVVSNSFGNSLGEDWEISLDQFSAHYLSLKNASGNAISVTPKVESVLFKHNIHNNRIFIKGTYCYATCKEILSAQVRWYR